MRKICSAVGVLLAGPPEGCSEELSWSVVVAAIASFTGLQLAYYAAVGLILHFSRVKTTIPGMQAAIGQRLGAELEVPRTPPPELSALVARCLEVDGAASLIPTRSLLIISAQRVISERLFITANQFDWR
jgi:hypothetical protein